MTRTTKHNIVYLTSGAAGMYCGSCMHDNTLVRALIRQGHDVQLVPTYTPIRTDEENVSADQVFFGGINVYLQQRIPLFRHVPRMLDRFLDRPGLIRRVASRGTNMKPAELGKLTVSMLQGNQGAQRKEVRRLCDWLQKEAQPELIVFTNMLIGGCIPEIKKRLGTPVVVTLQGDDIFLKLLPEPYQRQALERIAKIGEHVDRFVTHTRFYANEMSEYLGLDRSRIEVTPLGMDIDDFQTWPGRYHESAVIETASPVVGYFARLDPDKGLHLLVDAFIQLRRQERDNSSLNRNSRLRIAGWLGDQQRAFADEQFAKLRDAGLENDFEYLGSVDRHEKIEFFKSIDVLSVPTIYREPKGLFALEAMASGVPVVLPDHGAFPEMIADTGGGILFQAGSATDLAERLSQLISDHDRRAELGRTGRDAVHQRRNAEAMAESAWQVFQDVIG